MPRYEDRGTGGPEGLRNPTNYVERMLGAKASLLQTRQRLQALKDLGHYTGNVGASWSSPAIEALKAAQATLGVQVDGKWGPETEDAIQKALQKSCDSPEGCAADEADSGDAGPASDALAPMRIVGGVVAGLAVAGLTAALAATFRRRRHAPEKHDGV